MVKYTDPGLDRERLRVFVCLTFSFVRMWHIQCNHPLVKEYVLHLHDWLLLRYRGDHVDHATRCRGYIPPFTLVVNSLPPFIICDIIDNEYNKFVIVYPFRVF
jgi:hypothetical protein